MMLPAAELADSDVREELAAIKLAEIISPGTTREVPDDDVRVRVVVRLLIALVSPAASNGKYNVESGMFPRALVARPRSSRMPLNPALVEVMSKVEPCEIASASTA